MNLKSIPYTKVVIFILIFGLIAFVVLYPLYCLKPIERFPVKHTTIIMNASNPAAADSVYRLFYQTKIDSIQNVLNDVNNKYLQEIDTSINKMNGWVGFWISIITFIISIAGLWQYLQVKNHDERFRNLKKDLDSKWDSKKYEIDNFRSKLDADQKFLSDRLKVESNLVLLMRTISAIHDPAMVFDIAERRILVIEFMGKISKLINDYSRHLLQQPVDIEVKDNYVCILMNVRLFLIRSTILFRSYIVNDEIRNFVIKLRDVEKRVKNQTSLRDECITSIVTGLNELQNTMKRDSL